MPKIRGKKGNSGLLQISMSRRRERMSHGEAPSLSHQPSPFLPQFRSLSRNHHQPSHLLHPAWFGDNGQHQLLHDRGHPLYHNTRGQIDLLDSDFRGVDGRLLGYEHVLSTECHLSLQSYIWSASGACCITYQHCRKLFYFNRFRHGKYCRPTYQR